MQKRKVRETEKWVTAKEMLQETKRKVNAAVFRSRRAPLGMRIGA